jgi:dienelactone hydrolase
MARSVFGLFGSHDQNSSPEDVDELDAALSRAGVPLVFDRHDGAGHSFQNDSNLDRCREAQSKDAWEKIIRFLGETLN